jgi:DNA-binding MarR family transcriptional regulator
MLDDFYPDVPGHRGVDTSIAAADDIAPSIGRLQRLVLHAIASAGPVGRSTNELAGQLSLDRSSVQPRTSELRSKNLITDSGFRRRNANGKRAIVWVTLEHKRSEKL